MNLKDNLVPILAGALATVIIGLVVGSIAGVFSRGAQAQDEDLIKAVIAREMVSEDDIRRLLQENQKINMNGQTLTYGQALSKISTDVTEIKSEQKHLKEALEALTE